jgi:predicted  nucleic acid-binding Zn-ribbon protein
MANTTGMTPNEIARADRKAMDKLERIQMERDWDSELKATAAKRKAEELNNPKKGVLQTLKEKVMGTEEQNQAAKERMRNMDEKNPDSAQAKINKALGMKKGGMVSSASKRADGCAIKGKTKGKMV